ncbi:MAG: PorV/PorQ family protein [Bacteroidota bacterium]
MPHFFRRSSSVTPPSPVASTPSTALPRRPFRQQAPRLGAALALVVLLAPVTVAQSGTSAAEFLNVPVGARATAMGGAFGSTASDGTALYWNPAGLATMDGASATFEYAPWYVGSDFNFASVTGDTPFGTVAVGFTALTYDDMDVIREDVNNQEPTGETFSAGSYAVSLAYATQLTDRFSIGGTVKAVHENISESSATGVAFDVGTLFETPFQGVRLGASIVNFGSKMSITGEDLNIPFDPLPGQNGNNNTVPGRISTDAFDLPLTMRVGLSGEVYERAGTRVTLAVDALSPSTADQHLNLGAEVGLLGGLVQLRGGYQELFMEESTRSFTAGGGIRYAFGTLDVTADYAYEANEFFDGINRIAVALRF